MGLLEDGLHDCLRRVAEGLLVLPRDIEALQPLVKRVRRNRLHPEGFCDGQFQRVLDLPPFLPPRRFVLMLGLICRSWGNIMETRR